LQVQCHCWWFLQKRTDSTSLQGAPEFQMATSQGLHLDNKGTRIRVGYVSDTDTRGIRAGCVPATYRRLPERIGLKLPLRYVSEGGIRPISIPPPGLPDALQNRTCRHSVYPHARERRSRGMLAARRRQARRRRATGDEIQPLEKLLPRRGGD